MFVTHIISANDFERAVLSLVLGAYAYTVQCYDTMQDFLKSQHDAQGCIILEISELMLAQQNLRTSLSLLAERFPLILMADDRVGPQIRRLLPDASWPVIRRPVVKNELLHLLQTLREAQPALP